MLFHSKLQIILKEIFCLVSGVFTIKEGKNIEENDKNSIIVHEEIC